MVCFKYFEFWIILDVTSITMSTNELHDDNITHVGLNGMKIDPSSELLIYRQGEDIKDSLLANRIIKERT